MFRSLVIGQEDCEIVGQKPVMKKHSFRRLPVRWARRKIRAPWSLVSWI
jgi:hypothetical protein